MQTFLSYADFDKALSCLDPKRLGNQIYREVKTIISGGWATHPASRMWMDFRGRCYKVALAEYALAGLRELTKRGREYPRHFEFFQAIRSSDELVFPPWLGNEAFHASHRSNLLRKNPGYYSQFGWTEPPNLPYVWPK